MMLKRYYPEKWSKRDLPRIEPLILRYPLTDLDLDLFYHEYQFKVHKQSKTVH
jgi:hypothetical protein